MYRKRILFLSGLFLFLVTCVVRVDQGWADTQDASQKDKAPRNELKEAMNSAATQRKSEGLGRTTTSDDRKLAAKNAAARKAAHQQQLKAKGEANP